MNRHLRIAILVLLIGASIPLASYLYEWIAARKSPLTSTKGKDCSTSSSILTVNDTYLGDLLKAGSQVEFTEGFYKCNEPRHDDLVVFRMSSELPPVVRIVRGVPGDTFAIRFDDAAEKWEIVVNGERLEFMGTIYRIGHAKAAPPLKQDMDAFLGLIPQGRVLILSQLPPGTSDSGTFGLVPIEDVIGKVSSQH